MAKVDWRIFIQPKMAVIGVLGVASGLPSPLVGDAVTAWCSEHDVDVKTIGWLAYMTLPLGLKFLWSPWLDRALPGLPRRRAWLIILQLLVALGIFAIGRCAPADQLSTLAGAMLILSFLSASQDVVIDAYRADRLRRDEVGFGSAMATTGWRIGFLCSGALVFPIAERWGWPMAFTVMAMVQASTVVVSLMAKEPEVPLGDPPTLMETIVQPFLVFWETHRSTIIAILIFAAIYKASDAIGNRMAVPYLKSLGYDGDLLGWRGGLGMPLAILGGIIGGVALPMLGMGRALVIGGLLQALSNLVYLPLAWMPVSLEGIVLLVVVENLTMGVAVAAFMGFLLTCCVKAWSGTQYALLTAAMFLGGTLLSGVSGELVAWLGYQGFFLATVCAGLPGILLVPQVLRRQDQST